MSKIIFEDLKKLPQAWFNVVPYREVGLLSAKFLEKAYDMPFISTSPIGIVENANFIRQIQSILKKFKFDVNFEKYIDLQTRFVSQSAWFSRSIDCQNLSGKTAVVFGDATHAVAITKILSTLNDNSIK